MAHVYLLTRGPVHQMQIWEANMQSQLSDWKRWNLNICKCGEHKSNHTKKIKCKKFEKRLEIEKFQWALRPIKLWEVCVPKEAVPELLWYLGIPGGDKQCHAKELEKFAWAFRKALKLKKLPSYNEETLQVSMRLIYRAGISIYGLGLKDDDIKEFPQWGYKQEGL